ncbi:hypothetical protein pclt_cds_446 [Pandoravirus celtis]|uniref:Uncharacterized protein n=1 Tax=Pandoravirus celtis TaxID=2568002 RepID=A0A4D6EGU8_9VIRU|nr:hypothetical protein pclt_cds_446 [Pandoravirus celtis]
MRRWLKRLLSVRRRRRPTKSYETLSSPYPPLLAELDALVQRPVRLCDRETRTVEFYVDTVERTFARYGLDVRSRTFGVVTATDDDTVVLKGRTHAGRSWMVTITRADPRDPDVVYHAHVRLGDCHYDGLVVCPLGSRIVPHESLI